MSTAEPKLKICHVITRMIVGGAQENTLFTVLDHLAKGHEVVLVTGPSPGREGELLNFAGKNGGGEVIVMPELVRELNPLKDYQAVQKLKISSWEEYIERYREDPRLPPHPERIYASVWKEKGGLAAFLGKKK